MLRTVYIIYLTVMVLPGSLCIECSSSMDDDKMYYYNDSVMLPLESYCFVNEHSIRLKESNVLLNVINNTGDWIIATNTTNMFTVCINGSINNCSSDDTGTDAYQFNTALYIIQFISCSAGIIVGIANISMHLIYKELRTVSGILIIILCIITCIGFSIGVTRITITYYQINAHVTMYLLLFNLPDVFVRAIYESTRTTVLIHLAYTMYRSYRVVGEWKNERSLLCRYITFIIVASTASATVIITAYVITHRNMFDSEDRQCAYYFNTLYTEGGQLPIALILIFAFYSTWLFTLLIFVAIILVLYFLTTKKCCATSSTSRDLRVSVILIATADLSAIISIILVILHVSRYIVFSVTSPIFAVEQLALFTLFATSSKVKCCCMEERETHTTYSS